MFVSKFLGLVADNRKILDYLQNFPQYNSYSRRETLKPDIVNAGWVDFKVLSFLKVLIVNERINKGFVPHITLRLLFAANTVFTLW